MLLAFTVPGAAGCQSVAPRGTAPRSAISGQGATLASNQIDRPTQIKQVSHQTRAYRIASPQLLNDAPTPTLEFAPAEVTQQPPTTVEPTAEPNPRTPVPDIAEAFPPTQLGLIRDVEPDSQPPPNSITLVELQQLAATNHPAIAKQAARVRALHGKWTQVGLTPNPTAGYVGSEIGNEGAAGQQGVFVGQAFVRGEKLQLNRNIVCDEIRQAEQQLAADYQRVANSVAKSYYELLFAQRRRDLAQQLVMLSNNAVATSQSLLAAQEVSQVALLQSEMQAQEAEILKRKAANTYDAAWRQLVANIGLPSMPVHSISDDHQSTDFLSWNETKDRLLAEHPGLAAAASNIQRAYAVLRRAVAEPIPDVNVQVAFQYDYATDDLVTGVQFGMPIPIWNQNQGAVCEARAAVGEAEQEMLELELTLQERLAEQYRRLASANFEVERYNSEILPRAERTMEIVSRAYAEGEVGYLEQLAAQRVVFQTNLAYLDAQQNYWQAWTLIDGLLLE